MASTGHQDPEALDDETRWRSAGDRIQTLLDASASSGTVGHERTQQLALELTDLYGAALARIVTITAEEAPELVDRFATDELVASLMLVHGLHPHGVKRRIEDALDSVRPYLGSHGGDVALLDVVDGQDGPVVRLQFAGSCKSCPSSAVTLEFAVEDAVRAAAPEIAAIEVVTADSANTPSLISVDSLMSRVHPTGTTHSGAWHPLPEIEDLRPGEVGGFLIAGVPILACRVGDELYTYHDRCGQCHDSMAGAALHRPMGAPVGQAVLRCPRCHAHFDVVHAGALVTGTGVNGTGVNGTGEASAHPHLAPIPLLRRDGVLSIAVHAEATGVR